MPNVKNLRVVVLLLMGVAVAGCAEQGPKRPAQVRQPGYFVPTAAVIQRDSREGSNTAAQVLPSSDGDIWIVRGEKSVAGNIPINEFSAFTVYTYDVQTITNHNGNYGYRYRVGVQSGISVP